MAAMAAGFANYPSWDERTDLKEARISAPKIVCIVNILAGSSCGISNHPNRAGAGVSVPSRLLMPRQLRQA
jgi:hypothetical protein